MVYDQLMHIHLLKQIRLMERVNANKSATDQGCEVKNETNLLDSKQDAQDERHADKEEEDEEEEKEGREKEEADVLDDSKQEDVDFGNELNPNENLHNGETECSLTMTQRSQAANKPKSSSPVSYNHAFRATVSRINSLISGGSASPSSAKFFSDSVESESSSTQMGANKRRIGKTPTSGAQSQPATPKKSAPTRNKRRSTWRNLLNPNYKCRSDDFNKLFCDIIPKGERLIADFSCALHREILIQGRLYFSINYIAFYSNIFTWVTKLVVRLRNIKDICKANTARFIPNAIQVITLTGEKHVFASFVARDKAFELLLKLWDNNRSRNRTKLSDKEMRELMHSNYGKDLGMPDNEELKINSVEPCTPEQVETELSLAGSEPATGLRRWHSSSSNNNAYQFAESRLATPDSASYPALAAKHSVLSSSLPDVLGACGQLTSRPANQATLGGERAASGKAASSHAVLDDYSSFEHSALASRVNNEQVIAEVVSRLKELPSIRREESQSSANSSAVLVDTPESGNLSESEELYCGQAAVSRGSHCASPPEVEVCSCECQEHAGKLQADEQFRASVDSLYQLLFHDSDFMRAHLAKRGVLNPVLGDWLNGESGERRAGSLEPKPRRELDYSMSINHVWAKQVHVHELQTLLRRSRSRVYVLSSSTANSGIPYGETFSLELSYCLTRSGLPDRSRLLVHSCVNFHKDKDNWKLSMVKPLIEKQSQEGVQEFVRQLVVSLRERLEAWQPAGEAASCAEHQGAHSGRGEDDALGPTPAAGKQAADDSAGKQRPAAPGARAKPLGAQYRSRSRSRSKALMKARRKERKLKSLYRYYMSELGAPANTGDTGQQVCDRGALSDSDEAAQAASDSLSELAGDDDDASMLVLRDQLAPANESLGQESLFGDETDEDEDELADSDRDEEPGGGAARGLSVGGDARRHWNEQLLRRRQPAAGAGAAAARPERSFSDVESRRRARPGRGQSRAGSWRALGRALARATGCPAELLALVGAATLLIILAHVCSFWLLVRRLEALELRCPAP